MISPEEQAKIDAALDAALDELDSDEEDETVPSSYKTSDAVPVVKNESEIQSEHQLFTSMLQQMLDDGTGETSVNDFISGGIHENEVLGRFMQEIQSRMQLELAQVETTEAPSPTKSKTTTIETPTKSTLKTPKSEEEAVQSVISNLVHGLSQQVKIDDDDVDIDDLPDMDDPEMVYRFMESMMGPGMGSIDPNSPTFNPDAVIDGMMEQLLCKDLMYEPMKQVATKFPQWLEEKRSSLSIEEYSMYVCCVSLS
jgi:hypothetical protein